MSNVTQVDGYKPDYKHTCENCGADHVVTATKDNKVVYQGTMCGVCTWGESKLGDEVEVPDELC